jgi:hypothetical protein
MPTAPDWEISATCPWSRLRVAERRVETDRGVGVDDAEAVRADQSDVMGTAELEKLPLLLLAARSLLGEARAEHDQSPRASCGRIRCDGEHARGRHRHDDQVERPRQRRQAVVLADPVDAAGEAGLEQGRMHLARHGGRAGAADDGDAGRLQHRTQGGALGLHLAAMHRMPQDRAVGEVHVELRHPGRHRGARREPALPEQPHHARVLHQHVRGELRDPVVSGQVRQVLEQQRTHTEGLVGVVDEQGEVCAGRVALQPGEARHRDDPAPDQGHQCGVVPRLVQHVVDVPLARAVADGEVAHHPGAQGDPGVQGSQRRLVGGREQPDLGDVPVAQQDIP